jgi:hypothetical protein
VKIKLTYTAEVEYEVDPDLHPPEATEDEIFRSEKEFFEENPEEIFDFLGIAESIRVERV